ncbi:MAG: hypothetical protein K2N90_07510 [Lachnospiraceae bacterium]|nr:hypothetical protein [Lachnospiraceae bacterium]
MKNKRIAVYLCIATLLAATGCSSSETDTVAFDDAGKNTSTNAADTQEDIGYQENDNTDRTDATGTQENNNDDYVNAANEQEDSQSQADTELDGSVESIGDNSIVINKIFTSETTAVSYAGDEKVLITAYFSEETTYEIRTVKNSGVNGDADVTKEQGAFSDIKEQSSVNMTGSYEGDDFHAKHVIIYRFV